MPRNRHDSRRVRARRVSQCPEKILSWAENVCDGRASQRVPDREENRKQMPKTPACHGPATISPCQTSTACPDSWMRSPHTRTRNTPPRAEA